MKISIIAAVSANGVIGQRNALPWRQKADMRRFYELTKGHIVIIGRKTYESILARNGRPLKERTSIVLSSEKMDLPEGCLAAQSWGEALMMAADRCKTSDEEIFVIGGARVYRMAMPCTDYMYLTKIDVACIGDAFFPEHNFKNWRKVKEDAFPPDDDNQYPYVFNEYKRVRTETGYVIQN